MVFIFALFSLANVFAQNQQLSIAGWREVEGIDQAKAIILARDAIAHELRTRKNGQTCGMHGLWGLELNRGSSQNHFAVTAYTHGPRHGCLGSQAYDCAVSFRKAAGWRVNSVDCEPVNREWGN